MTLLQGADATPTSQVVAAVKERREALDDLMERTESFLEKDVPAINAVLKETGLPPIAVER